MNLFNPCSITMNSIGVPSPLLIKSFRASKAFLSSSFSCCCSISGSSSESEEKKMESVSLSGIVNEQVEELLSREENKSLLDGLEKATLRVEMAKKQLAIIQEQELAAKQFRDYVNQLEGKASELCKIEECQREISQAKDLVEEAERTLSESGAEYGEEIDRDRERLESVKAASISALVGTISGLPICFTHVTDTTQLLLPLAINFISCALFGVTFRYTIRRNLDDVQLKTGVAAAFGVVKGLGTLGGGPFLELNFESFLSHALDGTILVSESLFIFICAAVGLDFCFKTRLLSTFPIDRSV